MKRLGFFLSAFFLLLLPFLILTPQVQAAMVRYGDSVIIGDQEPTKNPYLFGDTIRLTAPVDGDVVSAGGNINIEGETSGSTNIAGGNLTVKGTTGNSVRAAGGNIIIDGEVTNDVVVAGGNITITKNARIGGDLLFAGGTLIVEGPVAGKIHVAGGQITVNSTVGRGFEGEVGKLVLGSSAVINGDLKYGSQEKAQIDPGARITGKTIFEQRQRQDREEESGALITGASIYKLISDILISLLFVYFLGRFAQKVIDRMRASPFKNAAIGFSFIALFPMAAVLMLILVWLGFAAFLFLGLVSILAIFLVKLAIGWFIMRWWEGRNNRTYILDWKAAVVGPIVLFLVLLLPFFGWVAAFILFLIALGALLQEVVEIIQTQKIERKAVKKKAS